MKPLEVSPADLQRVSGHMEALAGQLGANGAPSAGAGSSWQSSVAGAGTARAGAATDRAALAARMRATAKKVAAAGVAYGGSDTDAASALAGQVV
ncbi:hypothetical protein [Mycobacterium kyorinense]|uniref:ESX-1 secretion-associated protein n=1 Tax=Mycobacterium kyorinense TaxID=487514 RepID=A0A1X1Y6M0_9MYCO|nr:hypothetical protein [Mycobacterium kyorinense]ORW06670.1 hypothetical protein AWC14_01810 [Mycobacterium kyorinense]